MTSTWQQRVVEVVGLKLALQQIAEEDKRNVGLPAKY
jgi:hypothetical protein